MPEANSAARPESSSGHTSTGHTSDGKAESFPLEALPPELRELIYYHAMSPFKPVDTAAIPGTPQHIRIPAIAQLSRKTRKEALYVLSRSRPIEVSLYSSVNVERALAWARNLSGRHDHLIFSGRISQLENNFFRITLRISDQQPYFQVSSRPAASAEADTFIAGMKTKMLHFLSCKVDAQNARQARLCSQVMCDLIKLLDDESKVAEASS